MYEQLTQCRQGPFIATQLNSMSSWVELRRRNVYSDADATQLNWTDLLRADWLYAATGSVALPIVGDSWVASVRVSIATQLNSTSSWVELCRYKRACTCYHQEWRDSNSWTIVLRCRTAPNTTLTTTQLTTIFIRCVLRYRRVRQQQRRVRRERSLRQHSRQLLMLL